MLFLNDWKPIPLVTAFGLSARQRTPVLCNGRDGVEVAGVHADQRARADRALARMASRENF